MGYQYLEWNKSVIVLHETEIIWNHSIYICKWCNLTSKHGQPFIHFVWICIHIVALESFLFHHQSSKQVNYQKLSVKSYLDTWSQISPSWKELSMDLAWDIYMLIPWDGTSVNEDNTRAVLAGLSMTAVTRAPVPEQTIRSVQLYIAKTILDKDVLRNR